MKPLHGALVALIMLPTLLAQRVLTTAPIPDFANRAVDAVVADAAGNVYIASRHYEGEGYTRRVINLVSITKYSRDGDRLYEISFPCCSSEGIRLLAADTRGGVVFSSIAGNAPILNALQPQPLGRDLQTFVAKLDPAGNLIFSTYLGGTGSNQIHAIALDAAGAIYATGLTSASDFPVTPDGYQKTRYSVNAPTAFIAKLSANGDRLLYSTYLGGATAPCIACSVSTIGRAIAVDADGNVYVAGDSSDPDLPVTADSLQPAAATGGFVAKLDPTGSKLLYLTRIPPPITVPFAVVVDGSGAAYVAGIAGAYNLGTLMKIRPGLASPLYSLALPLGSPRVLQLVPDNEVVVLGTGFISRVNEAGSSFTTSIAFPAFGSLSPSGDAYLVSYDNWLTHYRSLPTIEPSLLGAGSAAVAGLTRRVSPGEIVSIYGFNLGPEQGAAAKVDESNRIATSLSGVRVSFDGNPAPLLYVSSRQINAVAPFNLAGRDTAKLTVETPDGSTTTRVPVVAAQPEAFRVSTGFGAGFFAAGINEDGSLLSMKEAPLRSIVSLFVTGLGTLDPQVPDGSINRTPLSKTTLPIVVRLAPTSSRLPSDPAVDPQLEILYAGPAPGLVAGAFQVNFRMPGYRGLSNSIRVYLEAGGIRGSVVDVPAGFF